MKGKSFLLAIALCILPCGSLWANPSIVNIRLAPGEPRTVEITPRATVVCRNDANCPTDLNFRWVGSTGNDPTEVIVVEYKNGLYWDEEGNPAQIPATDCFDFPDGKNPFELRHGPANGRNLVFKQDAEACKDKVVFFFDISCQNEAKDSCGGVVTLDPGTMVDDGRR